MRRWVIGVGICLCTACQTYTVTTLNTVHTNDDVRLQLTDQGRTALASSIGPGAVSVEGTITGRDSGGVRLAVREIVRGDGMSNFLHGEGIVIPADAVQVAERKRLSPVRSALVAGAVLVGSALVARSSGGDNVSATQSGRTAGAQ